MRLPRVEKGTRDAIPAIDFALRMLETIDCKEREESDGGDGESGEIGDV